ncbi:uncharacterized protein LOC118430684 [Branchiostoma floridae]|uniref:Uncharacterized protein LOC118430684 n=2 Tax=Branchiostoma floridae TaxID=7739 RepID=A0A9J7NC08_BRAFL|nr:uncharacterized protein LOC118430684 [Branchiostoma floridae]
MRAGAVRWWSARRPLLTRLAAAALISGTFSCVFFIYLTGRQESGLFKAFRGGRRGLKTWNGSETQGGNVLRDGRQEGWSWLSETEKGKACEKKKDFVFVKVHKAGSTTTACIFQRFGYEHGATFVLPRNHKSDIGWPNLLKMEDLIPSAGGAFNILTDHIVYDRRLTDHLMTPDAVYLTILRHPLDQLKSVFNWFHLPHEYQLEHSHNPIATFLENPEKYQDPYVTSRQHRDPFSLTKNFMSFDLGYPMGLTDDQTAIKNFITQLDKEMFLVLILEHYMESLVLLKRLMCWTIQDILYDLKPKNQRQYAYRTMELPEKYKKKHQEWSNVDYGLYNHFNQSLWNKIGQQGDDFAREVEHFDKVVQKVSLYCRTVSAPVEGIAPNLTFPKSQWDEGFTVDPFFCTKLKMLWQDWEYVLKKTHKLPRDVSQSVKNTISYHPVSTLTPRDLLKIFGITAGPELKVAGQSKVGSYVKSRPLIVYRKPVKRYVPKGIQDSNVVYQVKPGFNPKFPHVARWNNQYIVVNRDRPINQSQGTPKENRV